MSQTIGVVSALVVSVVFAIVCASLAGGRNRSRVGWAILGFFYQDVELTTLW
jgi:hypothetical protein